MIKIVGEATSWATASLPTEYVGGTSRAATVEVFRGIGGLPQRALLGAVKTPSAVHRLDITVPTSGEFLAYGQRSAVGPLGRALIPGLPDELAQPVLSGLLAHSTTAGEVRVTSAAYDAERSSYLALFAAAQILSIVLHSTSDDLTHLETTRLKALMHP